MSMNITNLTIPFQWQLIMDQIFIHIPTEEDFLGYLYFSLSNYLSNTPFP